MGAIRVDIAAYGWEHPEWEGAFYPEDLPEAWRLDFYCNEFRAVVVPAALWAGDSSAGRNDWATGLGEETRVYLELPAHISLPRIREASEALTDRLAGFVASGEPENLPTEPGVPVGIWSRAAPRLPPAPGVGWCWPGQAGVPQCVGDGLATAWIGPEPMRPLALRRIIEALAAAAPAGNALLVVRGGPGSLGLMRDAETLATLLGL